MITQVCESLLKIFLSLPPTAAAEIIRYGKLKQACKQLCIMQMVYNSVNSRLHMWQIAIKVTVHTQPVFFF